MIGCGLGTVQQAVRARLLSSATFTGALTRAWRHLLVSDSVGAGRGSGTGPTAMDGARALAYFTKLRDYLIAAGVPASSESMAGEAWNSIAYETAYDPRVTGVGTGWGNGNATAGGYAFKTASSSAVPLGFAPVAPVTTFDIYSYDGTPGSFTYAIDGGSPTTVTYTAADAMRKTTIAGLTLGTHTVTITRVSGAVEICQIEAYDANAKEARFMNAGVRGAGAKDWVVATKANSMLPSIGVLAPDITWIALGGNDIPAQIPLATFKADIELLIQEGLLSGKVVLINVIDSGDTSGLFTFAQLKQVHLDLAVKYNLPLYDINGDIGNNAYFDSQGWLNKASGASNHPNALAYDKIGQRLVPMAKHVMGVAALPVPVCTTRPTNSGTAQVGVPFGLSDNGVWTGNPTGFAYVLNINGVPQPSITTPPYLPVDADQGKKLSWDIYGFNGVAGKVTTAQSAAVLSAGVLTVAGTPPAGRVGASYLFAPSAAGGTSSKAWSYSGDALTPHGLVFDPAAGTIATPTATLSLTGTPDSASLGAKYSFTPVSGNGLGTKRYTYSGDSLSAHGLAISATTGAIMGTITGSAGTLSGTIRVTDDSGAFADLPISIVIGAAASGPVTVVTDTFTGADDVLISSRAGESGHHWVASSNGWAINNNGIYMPTASSYVLSDYAAPADQWAEIPLAWLDASTSQNAWLLLRSDGANNHYILGYRASISGLAIFKGTLAAGVVQVSTTIPFTRAAGAAKLLRGSVVGNTVTMSLDGAVAQTYTDTSSSPITTGSIGFFSNATSSKTAGLRIAGFTGGSM